MAAFITRIHWAAVLSWVSFWFNIVLNFSTFSNYLLAVIFLTFLWRGMNVFFVPLWR